MRTLIAFVLILSVASVAVAGVAPLPCKVNVNQANPEQLALLIRTGPALAGRIVAARPLDLAKLDAVSGVGPKWLEHNGPHVAFEGATTCTEKLKAPKAPAQ